MQTKKIISIVLTLIMVSALCVFAVPSASAATNVNLVYAKTVGTPKVSETGTTAYTDYAGTGYIEVANIAYAKNVVVHYTTDDKNWYDINATYFKAGTGNNEIWQFTTPGEAVYYRGLYRLTFAIKYEVNGQTYWDNNNGQNYYIEGGYSPIRTAILGGATNVALAYCDANTTNYNGKVLVKNIGQNKDVKVRYTTNNWASYQEVTATFKYSDTAVNTDEYIFTIPTAEPVEFAISYTVNNQTYWDNNFGSNYIFG